MDKKIQLKKETINLMIKVGDAKSKAPALAPRGIKIHEFSKVFDSLTTGFDKGTLVRTRIDLFVKSGKVEKFNVQVLGESTSSLIRKIKKMDKFAAKPGRDNIGAISIEEIDKVVAIKLPTFYTEDIAKARRIVAGTARSMGFKIPKEI